MRRSASVSPPTSAAPPGKPFPPRSCPATPSSSRLGSAPGSRPQPSGSPFARGGASSGARMATPFTAARKAAYVVGSPPAGRSSLWYSVEPHSARNLAPSPLTAASTAACTPASSAVTPAWQNTASAAASRTSLGSTSSGRPTRTSSSEPARRSRSRRSATHCCRNCALCAPVFSKPAALFPNSRGSKQKTGTRLEAPASAAPSASLSCRRRSVRNHSSAVRRAAPASGRPRGAGGPAKSANGSGK
mmetsp:Transcript_45760/g.117069  ORF Transcript_45760/g.117069 Transcript_45760/m.117069 type:complete len:246 (-) Transcript_45760:23-760(-)